MAAVTLMCRWVPVTMSTFTSGSLTSRFLVAGITSVKTLRTVKMASIMTSPAYEMAGDRLGRRHQRMGTERFQQRRRLDTVTDGRTGSVGVDVNDVLRAEATGAQGLADRTDLTVR